MPQRRHRLRGWLSGGLAASGSVVHGPVLEIPSASSICIAQGESPFTWVEVKLPWMADSRGVMMAAAFSKNATCIVAADGRGDCLIEAKPLAFEVRQLKTLLEAAAWR